MANLTFLFWNVQGQERGEVLAAMCGEHRVDVAILAEPFDECDALAKRLAPSRHRGYQSVEVISPGLQIFTNNRKLALAEFQGFRSSRWSFLDLQFDGSQFLLGAVHLRSKLWSDEHDQLHEAILLADELRRCEKMKGHRRSIIVGDLNMSPFEPNVVSATGLHALTTKDCVREESRVVQGIEYPYFFNPMWRFFGDVAAGSPGTYFYLGGGRNFSLKWHIFDQVLIRPQVFPWWRDDVRILKRAGDESLADSRGHPAPEIGSDHFPILFKLRTARRG